MADKSKVAEAMSETDLAYLAGLIDGEGCFQIHRKPGKYKDSFTGKLVIGMSGPTIPTLHKRLKIGTVYFRKPQKEGWKGTYMWTLGKTELEPILPRLIPYLVGKQLQASTVLELFKTQSVYTRGETDCAWLLEAMRKLNKRGA